MRVSGDPKDPDYIPVDIRRRLTITLNDVVMEQVVSADDVAGVIVHYMRNDEPDRICDIVLDYSDPVNPCFKEFTVHGVVKFKFKEL